MKDKEVFWGAAPCEAIGFFEPHSIGDAAWTINGELQSINDGALSIGDAVQTINDAPQHINAESQSINDEA